MANPPPSLRALFHTLPYPAGTRATDFPVASDALMLPVFVPAGVRFGCQICRLHRQVQVMRSPGAAPSPLYEGMVEL